MASSDASVSIGKVTLTVIALDRVADFYEQVIGLNTISRDGETATLGAGNNPLITLRQDSLARRYPTEAGLFHTAFLLPERSDLGRWLKHMKTLGNPLDGATDHLVSEAIYLRDPEGNGIEVYCDRPRSEWLRTGDLVKMDTLPLDLKGLALASPGHWNGAPTDTVIGHVHLQVGDIGQADRFMIDQLGMKKTNTRPSAGWYGASGYHHHLAANVWNSQGAGLRSAHSTGLSEIEILSNSNVLPSGSIIDPWGTKFTVTTHRPSWPKQMSLSQGKKQ